MTSHYGFRDAVRGAIPHLKRSQQPNRQKRPKTHIERQTETRPPLRYSRVFDDPMMREVTRELTTVLGRLDLRVKSVTIAREAMTLLRRDAPDLLVVEMSALRFTQIGLADLADAARELGTRVVLLTSRSVFETAACASLIGAIASLNKWVPVRVTAERVNALVTHAVCARQMGVVFDAVA